MSDLRGRGVPAHTTSVGEKKQYPNRGEKKTRGGVHKRTLSTSGVLSAWGHDLAARLKD